MLAGFQGASSQILMMAVQVILVLRGTTEHSDTGKMYEITPPHAVQALYYEKTYLRFVLYGLFLAEVSTMTILFALSMPNILYGSHCVITSFPDITGGFL